MGKPNQVIAVVPLKPISAVEPLFTQVMIDVVGPLPPTSAGNKYLFTIMDVTTRYPEAIPVQSIHAKVIVKYVVSFFTHFGMPKKLQSDRDVNFTLNLLMQMLTELGIKHILSSAYHPQSQGALEKHHQILKTMLHAFCYDSGKDWDLAVPFVMFAI